MTPRFAFLAVDTTIRAARRVKAAGGLDAEEYLSGKSLPLAQLGCVQLRVIRHTITGSTMRSCIMWTKPSYKKIRLGFEITMYKYNR